MGSLVQGDDFPHNLRLLNTNVDGKNKIMYAMTAIKGIGRRFPKQVCKKAEVEITVIGDPVQTETAIWSSLAGSGLRLTSLS
ncbi:hypothetical protein VOLCADRAFT_61524 [Volvox carteri f. nagariensis]|uniref:Uncharacterized protein n=1 Tax=Volvox carteri f. nagariensis TaxID=3068 RepID=D8TYN3_VOLCA|nr:uncharacterized protein VOLCADRAFT_61524 [Volvox carteri f. nagariensis]EFJ47342.1 hypothetical protein VOLCADRAFT_61524 [Volvox carteri f. nagariensis]|eukprot:XP_002951531.1 hypothetical protein VOLCADRAFT_61524 [Volvox carteri f. nagariensis]